jgi:hypothetical protein
MQPRRTVKLCENGILVGLFFGLLWAPLVGTFGHIGQVAASDENRALAGFPTLTDDVGTWLAFPESFKKYYCDRFGFRKDLIALQAFVKVKALQTSASPYVVVGKEGWLFYSGARAMDYYRAADPLSEADLQGWLNLHRARNEWLTAHGIAYYVVVAPEKQTIYPEYIPDNIIRVGNVSRSQQFDAYLAAKSNIRLIDLSDNLKKAKALYPRIYNQTDSHWNGYGAFLAYRQILGELSKDFPGLHPLSQAECTFPMSAGVQDLVRMLGLTLKENVYAVMPRSAVAHMVEETPVRVVGSVSNPRLPRMVMFRDSFANAIAGLMSQHFSRSVYVWDGKLDSTLIRSENPDLVIAEMAERSLMAEPPRDPPYGQ